MTAPTLSDLRNVLRWSIVAGVALLSATESGSILTILLSEAPVAIPAQVSLILRTRESTLGRLLMATGAPPLIAQLAAYWVLERQLCNAEERDILKEWAEHRAAVRECEDARDPESAELCAIGDIATREYR